MRGEKKRKLKYSQMFLLQELIQFSSQFCSLHMSQLQSNSSSPAPNTADDVAHNECREDMSAITAQCQTVALTRCYWAYYSKNHTKSISVTYQDQKILCEIGLKFLGLCMISMANTIFSYLILFCPFSTVLTNDPVLSTDLPFQFIWVFCNLLTS